MHCMATSPKKSSPKKKPATARKTPTKPKAVVAKKSPKKPSKKAVVVSNKVDYYPNRMTVAISVLAGTILMLVTLIAVLGVQ